RRGVRQRISRPAIRDGAVLRAGLARSVERGFAARHGTHGGRALPVRSQRPREDRRTAGSIEPEDRAVARHDLPRARNQRGEIRFSIGGQRIAGNHLVGRKTQRRPHHPGDRLAGTRRTARQGAAAAGLRARADRTRGQAWTERRNPGGIQGRRPQGWYENTSCRQIGGRGGGGVGRSKGNRRVLVVEDEALIASLIETTLGDAGFSVVGPIATVASAIDTIERELVDLAVLDIRLNDMHAYAIADE